MTNIFSKEEIEAVLNHHPLTKDYYTDKGKYGPVRNFEVKDDDLFLIGFPKSGTTWAQEMVWLIGHDFDYDGANVFIDKRFPVIELSCQMTKDSNKSIKSEECHWNSLNYVGNMKSPRYIKSHLAPKKLPIQLLNDEKKAKIIYIARNVMDVCVSFHYFLNNISMSTCSLEDYCKVFISDICPLGKYWESVLYFWEHRNDDNILFIKYEEMKLDLEAVIQKVAKFLNKNPTKEEVEKLLKWLHFDSIKNNAAVNHVDLYNHKQFIRKGKTGEHKKEMTPEMIAKFDLWIKESLQGSDYEVL